MVKNTHKVPSKVWSRRWSDKARRVFNDVYFHMTRNDFLFRHPKAPKPKPEHWRTTAYNASWIAADAADGLA